MKNPILNTFKKMLEAMPIDEAAKMFVYKMVKSEQCREYEIAALILLMRRIGFCKDKFYNEKLPELLKDNTEEVYDLFYELSIPAPEGGEPCEVDI